MAFRVSASRPTSSSRGGRGTRRSRSRPPMPAAVARMRSIGRRVRPTLTQTAPATSRATTGRKPAPMRPGGVRRLGGGVQVDRDQHDVLAAGRAHLPGQHEVLVPGLGAGQVQHAGPARLPGGRHRDLRHRDGGVAAGQHPPGRVQHHHHRLVPPTGEPVGHLAVGGQGGDLVEVGPGGRLGVARQVRPQHLDQRPAGRGEGRDQQRRRQGRDPYPQAGPGEALGSGLRAAAPQPAQPSTSMR